MRASTEPQQRKSKEEKKREKKGRTEPKLFTLQNQEDILKNHDIKCGSKAEVDLSDITGSFRRIDTVEADNVSTLWKEEKEKYIEYIRTNIFQNFVNFFSDNQTVELSKESKKRKLHEDAEATKLLEIGLQALAEKANVAGDTVNIYLHRHNISKFDLYEWKHFNCGQKNRPTIFLFQDSKGMFRAVNWSTRSH
ncbi:hypothetical protein L596_009369 [Steinernema carpocapsae]|uniref:Uncharacterized protein n=1 Tax=Steinernema carpocapsae TaxID=34508 RepID=A0A4U5PFK1_STECR|nr:hypothetical protein L596_009369 [Steinernema carpocapsae]